MYRNITYYIDKEDNWQGKIRLDTWDENGIPITQDFKHNSYLYVEDVAGKYTSMFNKPLKRLEFNSVISRKNWIDRNPTTKLYECLPPIREFLLHKYIGQQESDEFQKNPLRIQYQDIEVAVEEIFPEPDKAEFPITVYDSILHEYHTWTSNKQSFDYKSKVETKDFSIDNIIYHHFNNELDMMKDFLCWFKNNRPDILTGYNNERFDIPYLVNRSYFLFNELFVNQCLSPVCKVNKTYREQRGDTIPISSYNIEGITILDYLILYKTKFGKKLEDYKLETVAQVELGYGKYEHKEYEHFKDFYTQDFENFVYYNIIDVKLLVNMEEKLMIFQLIRTICNMGLVEYSTIYSSLAAIYGIINLETKKNGLIALSDSKRELVKTSFTGAYVKEPVVGYYRKGVLGIDLDSLYPNIIILLNMSPETKIGKIVQYIDGIRTIKLESGEIKQLNEAQWDKFKERITLSANNIIYLSPNIKKGIIPSCLERMYDQRKIMKAKYVKSKKDISKLTEEYEQTKNEELLDSIKNIKSLGNRYFMYQNAYKVFLNSIYGQLGNIYYPFFDLDNAEAVTLTGQKVIKSSIDFINDSVQKIYGDQYKNTVLASDTDSSMFNGEAFINKVLGNTDNIKWTKRNIQLVVSEGEEFIKTVNEYINNLSKEIFYSPLRRFNFKFEKFCSEGEFLAKKRYVLHLRQDDGAEVDKFSYTGVDVKKNELPIKIKDVLKYVIENAMIYNWNNQDYSKAIHDNWETFKELQPNELAYLKNYNTEKNSEGFLSCEKGSGVHAKAAIYYNQLIKQFNLTSKYEFINPGDRLRYLYVKPNKYKIEVIGWKERWPKEFEEHFKIDYETMFEKIVLAPLKRFEVNHKWSKINISTEYLADLNSLFS